ncbi:MAG: HGGxSTG domain-containing protein [Caulobacteraceae bacterium]
MAKTRAGSPCQGPAVTGKARCRMHGGGRNSGAPKGKRNGSWRHGRETNEAVAVRREIAAVNREWRKLKERF